MSPDYQPQFEVPDGHEVGRSNSIWTPTNVEYLHSWRVGKDNSGVWWWKHEFRLSYMGETEMFGVIAREDNSDANIEDLAAGVSERSAEKILAKVQARGAKLRPEDLATRENWDVRRDLAGAWRELRKWSRKRKQSAGGKTVYGGITIAKS